MNDNSLVMTPTIAGTILGSAALLEIQRMYGVRESLAAIPVIILLALVLMLFSKLKRLHQSESAPVVGMGVGGAVPFLVYAFSLLF